MDAYENINLPIPAELYRLKSDIEWYRIENTIILDKEDRLVISVVNPKKNIENIKLALDATIKANYNMN